jgi:lipoyl(octanoyl) transferase
MIKLPHLRVIVETEPNSGAWNMAVDETLLNSAIESGVATLRFYQWCEPTVSLGYFQREDDVLRAGRFSQLPRVRRLSGGGMLVHDHELTYSLTLPSTQRLIERPMELFGLVHRDFVASLRTRGVDVELRGSTRRLADEPLLCFAREDEHDLVCQGHKVLGSAQRRRRGAMLQHGGLLLKVSSVTPELPGLVDLSPGFEPVCLSGRVNLANELSSTLRRSLADSASDGALTTREREAVELRIAAGSRERLEDRPGRTIGFGHA